MKTIGILGVGQAGGNLAEMAAEFGFPAALINTNPRDGQVNTKVEKKFFIPGYNGAGQDRSIGIRAVHDHYQELIEYTKHCFKDIKLLFVAFSTDGGTGSGMSPVLIDLLSEQLPGVRIGAIAVLPERNALAGNRINAATCMDELSKIDKLASVFLVDNDQIRRSKPQASKQEIYLDANEQALQILKDICDITKKSSFYGNFDETDLLNILCTRGVAVMSRAVITEARTAADVAACIQQSWGLSVFSPVETKGIIRAGLIYEGPESFTKLINIPAIFEKTGEPVQLFEGTYVSETDPSVTSLLAGLPFPAKRMREIEASVEQDRGRLQDLVGKEFSQNYESKVSWATRLIAKPAVRQNETVTAKLGKYK